MKTYSLKIGNATITDLMNPKSWQIDLSAIEARLCLIRRFSGDPAALTVYTHQRLVQALAIRANESDEVVRWCRHHDDHEAIIGDIPGPLKSLINLNTDVLKVVEKGLDRAICRARWGKDDPTDSVRAKVHIYDKQAETLEWVHVLGNPIMPWCANVHLPTDEIHQIFRKCGMAPRDINGHWRD